jgi:hypothetical protein
VIRRALALLVAFTALAAPAAALAAQPRTTLNDIEDEVMCVVCGVPLNIAESPQADRERGQDGGVGGAGGREHQR